MKYRVEIGAFVEYIRKRSIVVHAKNESEALMKASEQFEKELRKNPKCTEIFELHYDSIEEVEDE